MTVMHITRTDPIAGVIRAGVVAIARESARIGAMIFAPAPGWTPADGADALVPLRVAKVERTHIAATDPNGDMWVMWR